MCFVSIHTVYTIDCTFKDVFRVRGSECSPGCSPFPPHTWIRGYLRRADENDDGKMSYDEVKRLLQMINIDLNEQYARSLFKVSTHCLCVCVCVQHSVCLYVNVYRP